MGFDEHLLETAELISRTIFSCNIKRIIEQPFPTRSRLHLTKKDDNNGRDLSHRGAAKPDRMNVHEEWELLVENVRSLQRETEKAVQMWGWGQ